MVPLANGDFKLNQSQHCAFPYLYIVIYFMFRVRHLKMLQIKPPHKLVIKHSKTKQTKKHGETMSPKT